MKAPATDTATPTRRYRLPYPEAMIGRAGISGDGRLLDLACGTGQPAFPLRQWPRGCLPAPRQHEAVAGLMGHASLETNPGLGCTCREIWILRASHLDIKIKIKIERPDAEAAKDISSKYVLKDEVAGSLTGSQRP